MQEGYFLVCKRHYVWNGENANIIHAIYKPQTVVSIAGTFIVFRNEAGYRLS